MATVVPEPAWEASDSVTEEAAPGGGDVRVETDRAIFAQVASLRRLPSVKSRRGSFVTRPTSSASSISSSTPQLPTSSPLRRPATAAAATHSRVHEALRRNTSEFVFSCNQTTVEGICYSSRFPIKGISAGTHGSVIPNRPASSLLLQPSKDNLLVKTGAQTESDEPFPVENTDTSSADATAVDSQERKRELRRKLLAQRARAAKSAANGGANGEPAVNPPIPATPLDEVSFIQRRRRCAKTFEDMIAVRLKLQTDSLSRSKSRSNVVLPVSGPNEVASSVLSLCHEERDSGMSKLLEQGIIQSVMALSSSADLVTQTHCCRALYYLSQAKIARKPLISHGVVAKLKHLSRITAPVPRQDLAAMLCHLSEEDSVVEMLFFEGIDRSLVRLLTSPSRETRRICAVTIFNLSVDARQMKHFGEGFAQLLIAATKAGTTNGGSGFLSSNPSSSLMSSASYLVKAVYNASLVPMFHGALLGDNVPRFLALQLPNVPPIIQGCALRAFVSLCEVRVNRQHLLTSPFCQLLEAMLMSPDEEIQEITLLLLLLLSTDEGSRTKICNWLPVGSLIQATSQHVDKAFARSSATPSATSAITPKTPTTMESGGGPSHQEKPENGGRTDNLIFLSSCILRNLCNSVLTHHELIQEGSVQVLLEMSRMPHESVQANAICALCCLIASSTDEVAAHIPELTDRLLSLTRTSNPQDCVFAVGALYNISCSDDCVPLLADSGPLLDRLLQLASTPTHKKVAELIAAIIYRLAGDVDCVPQLLHRGFLPKLVNLIREYTECRAFALNALFLLARNGGEEFPHGGDEMAQLVLALLSNGKEVEAKEKTKVNPNAPSRLSKRKLKLDVVNGDPVTLRSGITLLAHLAHHPKNRGALVRNGAVFRFLKQLNKLKSRSKPRRTTSDDDEDDENDQTENEDDTILTNCAFVYYSLTATQEGCEFLVKERGVESLIQLSRVSTNSCRVSPTFGNSTTINYTVKELCVLSLCRLSSFVGLETRLVEQGAIEAVMVLALVATDSVTIKALCIKTLANCLVGVTPACIQSLVGHGIIWALASLCTVEFPETSYACAISLCNLSALSSKIPKFLDAGAPRALIHLLRHGGGCNAEEDAQITLVVVKAIANLVANEKLCQAFLNEGLEKHLSVHFSSPESCDELRQLAAMVLLRVTSANDAMLSAERFKLSVLLWMEQIIGMKDEDLVRNCMLTVHDLTCNASLDVTELDVPHVLRILVQVLKRHQAHNEQITTLCLSVLYNLSCQLSVLPTIVHSEIMPFLRQQVPLFRVPPSVSRRNANKSMTTSLVLAASALNSTPGTSPIPAAAPTPSAKAHIDAKLCCLVLHNLSCWYSKDEDQGVLAGLVACRAVGTLHDIYFGGFEGLQEIAAVAICNVAVGKVNSARVMEDQADHVLLHFIRSERFTAKHYHLVSAALRKLGNAPGNQTRLLAARAANAMVFMLQLPDIDIDSTVNVLATLCLFSSCKTHLQRLLVDGVLPCVARLADVSCATAEVLSYCFEIISNLCSVDFQQYVEVCPDINVVGTLAKLSEHHHHSYFSQQNQPTYSAHATSLVSYCARGEGCVLPLPQLLTYLIKSPTSAGAVKKNLELKATYTVPARKWYPEAQPKPKDPPPLVCEEIPLTDNGHCVTPEIKQRVSGFKVLPREALVRNEETDAAAPNVQNRQLYPRRNSEKGFGSVPLTSTLRGLSFRSRAASVMSGGGRKLLQRGHGDRNLSQRPRLLSKS